jgi:tetratricopeptide (TPR) repeat protein
LSVVLALFLAGCGGATQPDDAAAPPPGGSEPASQTVPSIGATAPARESSRRSEEALRALREAVGANPDNIEARRRLAIALHDSGYAQEALPHFEKVAALRPGTMRSLLDLAMAYSSLSRELEAERIYKRLLTWTPDVPVALHNLGHIAFKRGETERAVELYERAIAVHPGYLVAHFHLADALTQVGRYREAYRVYEHVLDLEATHAHEVALFDDALFRMASLDITMGAHERAARLLTALLRENPQHEAAYYAYGQVLLQLGREEEARRAFEAHTRLLERPRRDGPMSRP